jgi:AraC-like DNA-binding protein
LKKYAVPSIYEQKFEFYLTISKEVRRLKCGQSNVHSNLKLEEIAFLCNMSLSTFKRHFIVDTMRRGKWLQDKRRAKEICRRSTEALRYLFRHGL